MSYEEEIGHNSQCKNTDCDDERVTYGEQLQDKFAVFLTVVGLAIYAFANTSAWYIMLPNPGEEDEDDTDVKVSLLELTL